MPEEEKKGKEETSTKKSSKLPKVVKIGLGCVIILVILGIILAVVGVVLVKKFEQKTGIQPNLSDLGSGKVTFTDPKTGAKLDVGGGTIPTDFPKDFPIYPGAKVLSSLSGNQGEAKGGFWLTLTTGDATDKVKAFYETNLKANGWVFESTIGAGTGTNWTVTKGTLNGYLTIDKSPTSNETSILIVLGESSVVTTPQP